MSQREQIGDFVRKAMVDATVEGNVAYDEKLEKEGLLMLDDILEATLPPGVEEMELKRLMGTLKDTPKPFILPLLIGMLGGLISSQVMTAARPVMQSVSYGANRLLPTKIVEPGLLTLLRWRGLTTPELFTSWMRSFGYAKNEAEHFYNAAIPAPSEIDLMRATWRIRKAPDLLDETTFPLFTPERMPQVLASLARPWLSAGETWAWGGKASKTTEEIISRLGHLGFTTEEAADYIIASRPLPPLANLIRRAWWEDWGDENLFTSLARYGYNEADATSLVKGAMAYPSPELIVRWAFRQEEPIPIEVSGWLKRAGAPGELGRIYKQAGLNLLSPGQVADFGHREGWDKARTVGAIARRGYSQNDAGILEELSWWLPNPQDMIRMAVREVFTPALRESLQLDEEFPPPFAAYAQKIGIHTKVAKEFWAAHWDLPSATQGFEMLHRGLIDEDELKTLLKALDYAPVWREKLSGISWRLFGKRDVIRLLRYETIDAGRAEIEYRAMGYEPGRAKIMADFAVVYSNRQRLDYTRAQVLSQFKRGSVDEKATKTRLAALLLPDDLIAFHIKQTAFEIEEERIALEVDIIVKQFQGGRINEQKATDELTALGLSTKEVTWTMAKAGAERKSLSRKLTEAKITQLLKAGMLDLEQTYDQIGLLGYSDENTERIFEMVVLKAVGEKPEEGALSA